MVSEIAIDREAWGNRISREELGIWLNYEISIEDRCIVRRADLRVSFDEEVINRVCCCDGSVHEDISRLKDMINISCMDSFNIGTDLLK